MEFLKNHYEKVLLSLILLGLAVAAALLPMKVDTTPLEPPPTKGKALKPQDLKSVEVALERSKKASNTVLSGSHNLFNPVLWIRKPNGALMKNESGRRLGPQALIITNITPLYFVLAYDGVTGQGDKLRYKLTLTREADTNAVLRRPMPVFAVAGDKKDQFTLREVKGEADNPTELVLEVANVKELVTISKDQPYKRVDGYLADFRYDPEDKNFLRKRENDRLAFAGETHNIVAIAKDGAVLFTPSSGIRTTIKYHSAP
jgi:hypothetical protein